MEMATPMNIEFKEISWSDCKKIWVHHLWPGRPLQTMSSMVPYGELHLHEYKVDMEIYKKYFPYFFGAYVDGKLVGVIIQLGGQTPLNIAKKLQELTFICLMITIKPYYIFKHSNQ